MEIPKAVFTRYQSLSVQEGTRRHAVIFPGPVLLSESDVGALVDFIVARDAQNNGLSSEQIIVTIQDLNPALSKDQVTLFHLPCCASNRLLAFTSDSENRALNFPNVR